MERIYTWRILDGGGDLAMNVSEVVKDKANYAQVVEWFRGLGDLDQLVLLVDTIDEMSEEIFEHYKALCDILKGQLQRISRICRENGIEKEFPEASMRSRLAYIVNMAGREGAVLPEKYEWLRMQASYI